jgi:hypothetical protein
MMPQQLATLLARIQVGDNRKVDEVVILEWDAVVGDLDFDDAIAAVRTHRTESTEYLTPAHVVAGVRKIRALRTRAERIQRSAQQRAIPKAPLARINRDAHEAETAWWATYWRDYREAYAEQAQRTAADS